MGTIGFACVCTAGLCTRTQKQRCGGGHDGGGGGSTGPAAVFGELVTELIREHFCFVFRV